MSDDLNGAIADLEKAEAEIERLRQSIKALIEVYAPYERKAVLLDRHLGNNTEGEP